MGATELDELVARRRTLHQYSVDISKKETARKTEE
jgi:hypothetical protein